MKKIAILTLLMACCLWYAKAQHASSIRISGVFPAIEGLSVSLSNQSFDFEPIKIPVQTGKFDVEIPEIATGIYRLTFGWPDDQITQYRDQEGVVRDQKGSKIGIIKNFYVDHEQADHYLFVLSNEISLEKFRTLGSADLNKTQVFQIRVRSTSSDGQVYEKLDSLSKEYRSNSAWIRDSLFAAGTQPDKILQDFQREANAINYETYYPIITARKMEVIALHPESPVGAWALLEVGNDELRKDAEAYATLLNNMRGRARESSYFQKANAKLVSLTKIQTGNILDMPNGNAPGGEKVDYNPGDYSYTLVEFWASWCGPCRVTNPRWNEILKTYQQKGFQILGISLDANEADWKKAIEEDQLIKWIHVSDLEHPVTGGNATAYGIESIPYNLLLDKEGRIIQKNIKPVALEQLLKEMPD